MDWNLRHCGRHGHVTYAPDEPELCAHLKCETPVGTAWRCLRCGTYVVGEPRGSGPAELAPQVRRGRALRDLFILRFLAVERLLRGLLVGLIAYGVFALRNDRVSIEHAFNDDLPLIQGLADKFHWDVAHSTIVTDIRAFLEADNATLTWIAAGLGLYTLLQLIEATGLWLLQRWGEYFAVVATSMFIPLEIYELVEKITWVRIGALVLNVAAVVYLLLTKRLFGLRGGRAAHEAERHEANLLEVKVAAVAPKINRRSTAEVAAAEQLATGEHAVVSANAVKPGEGAAQAEPDSTQQGVASGVG